MKTITREEFKKVVFSVIKEIVDMAVEKNDIENGAILQLAGLAIMAKVEKKLFGEED